MSTGTVDVVGLEGDRLTLSPADLEALASGARGSVLRPGDDGWDAAVLSWNAMASEVRPGHPGARAGRSARLRVETGVAGLTLGGGFGYLTRRFGWTVDNLDEVEIVTADGQIRTANANENAELFWALRGGGGNFGVVTRFTLRLHEVCPLVTGGMILWGAERADEVLAAYRDLTESAPRELTAVLTIRLAPPAPFLAPEWHGKPIIGMVVCHTSADAANDLASLRERGSPSPT